MSSIARNLAVSITDYIKVNSSTTLPVPTPYGHIVVDFTGATGTLTFPDMSNVDAGGLITVRKSNETQGEVTNDPGLNPIITGSVVPRQYSDGDFFTYMWDGDRLVLIDGHETGENANGKYERFSSGRMTCETIFNIPFDANGISMDNEIPLPKKFTSIAPGGFCYPSGNNTSYASAMNISSSALEAGVKCSLRNLGGGTGDRGMRFQFLGKWYD